MYVYILLVLPLWRTLTTVRHMERVEKSLKNSNGQNELTKETEYKKGLVKTQDSVWVRESAWLGRNHRGWPPFSDSQLS